MINIDIYPREPEFQHLLELYPIQPANRFLPQWYKDNPKLTRIEQFGFDKKEPHAKECPAIQDELTNGFIIPSWSNIFFHMKDGEMEWEVSVGRTLISAKLADKWQWIGKQSSQQINLMGLNEIFNYGVLKFMSPYYFKTPPGYGLRFHDLFYHDQRSVRILPGQVETDIWHEVNFPFEFMFPTTKESKFFINAGDPLLMVTPYKKKDRFNLNLHNYDEDFRSKQMHNATKLFSISSDFKKYRNYKSNEEE